MLGFEQSFLTWLLIFRKLYIFHYVASIARDAHNTEVNSILIKEDARETV